MRPSWPQDFEPRSRTQAVARMRGTGCQAATRLRRRRENRILVWCWRRYRGRV